MDNYEITLRDNLRVMFKRARILIYFVIIALLSCYLFVSLCTPKYKSEVKLLVSGLPQVESPYYRQMTSFRTVDVATTISEVIKGRDFLRQVVLTLDLENREDEASFQTPLRKAFSFLYNRVKLATEGIQSLLGGKSGEEDKTEKAINYLSKNIDVESIERTDVVRVIAYDYNPQMAAKIADRLVKVFIIYNMQQQAFSYQSKYGEKHPRLVQLENEIKKMKNELNDEAGLTENWNRSNIKVINQAYVPTRPATPKKGLIFVVVIILSVIGGIIFVYILESLDHSFRSSRDVEKYMDVPLLATIPVYSKSKKQFDNSFNILLAHFYLLVKERNLKNMAITSYDLKDGKTFVVKKLAENLSKKNGFKTLLIDANFKNSSLHKLFNKSDKPGISEVLEGKFKIETVKHEINENLDLVVLGKTELNPTVLVGSDALKKIIDPLADKYDIVLIDAPYLKDSTESALLCKQVQSTTLIIKEEHTRREAVRDMLGKYGTEKINFLGVILNNHNYYIPGFIYKNV